MEGEPEEQQQLTPKESYDESLSIYYRLKKDYDKSNQQLLSRLRESAKLSLDQKRKKIRKKCVNCDYAGKEGTIFSVEVKHNSDPLYTSRILSAKCGNPMESQKCSLHIELDTGRFCLLPRIIEEKTDELDQIEAARRLINIKSKFGYIEKEELEATLASESKIANDGLVYFDGQLKGLQMNKNNEEIGRLERETSTTLRDFKNAMLSKPVEEELKLLMTDFVRDYIDNKKIILNLKYDSKYEVIEEDEHAFLRYNGVPIYDLDYAYMKHPKVITTSKSQSVTEATEIETDDATEALYKILKIKSNAPLKRIEKAYRELSKKYNPDAFTEDSGFTEDEGKRMFSEVSRAYQILKDKMEKKGGTSSGNIIMMNPRILYNMHDEEDKFGYPSL
jgi:hypothetical protein